MSVRLPTELAIPSGRNKNSIEVKRSKAIQPVLAFSPVRVLTSKPVEEEEEEVTSQPKGSWQAELTDQHFGDVITPAAVPLDKVPELNLPRYSKKSLIIL